MRARAADAENPIEAQTFDRVREFHRATAEAFARARQKAAPCRRSMRIGDATVTLEFAGDQLVEPMTRALEHLMVPAADRADLTIGLWEIESVRVPLPLPPWGNEAYLNRGEILGFNHDGHLTNFNPDGRILSVYDAASARAHVGVFNQAELPAYERAAPLRPILARFLETRGIQYLHAAAVGTPKGGVIITGKSGAGKSTTSLACLNSQLSFAGDDYCAARFDGEPTAFSVYSSAKGHAETVRRLGFLEPLISNPETMARDKAIWYLAEHFPDKLIREFPLQAILIPRVTGQTDTRVTATSPQSALRALAPSTISQLPNAGSEVFQHLAAVARKTPAFTLELGTEMTQIPDVILHLLRDLER
jgi:hypothetical protein